MLIYLVENGLVVLQGERENNWTQSKKYAMEVWYVVAYCPGVCSCFTQNRHPVP